MRALTVWWEIQKLPKWDYLYHNTENRERKKRQISKEKRSNNKRKMYLWNIYLFLILEWFLVFGIWFLFLILWWWMETNIIIFFTRTLFKRNAESEAFVNFQKYILQFESVWILFHDCTRLCERQLNVKTSTNISHAFEYTKRSILYLYLFEWKEIDEWGWGVLWYQLPVPAWTDSELRMNKINLISGPPPPPGIC